MNLQLKKKKIVIICVAVAILAALCGVLHFAVREGETSVMTGANTLILNLDKEGSIEAIKGWNSGSQDNKIYFFLPTYASQGDLYFSFLPEKMSLWIDGKKLVSGRRLYNIKIGDTLPLTIKEEGKQAKEYKVCFMRSKHLSTIYIDTNSGNMDKVRADKAEREAGSIRYYTESGRLLYGKSLAYIKGHGNQTWELDKRSYTIGLKDEYTLCGMEAAKKWVLLANAWDDTHIRNALVFNMAGQLDLSYTPSFAYVDLYLNGEYAGNYQLTEKIEINKDRVDIADLEKKNVAVNNSIHTSPKLYGSTTSETKGLNLKNNPADITGGYLLERNYGHKYEVQPSGFITDADEHFVLRSPANATQKETTYIRDYMQHLENAIYAKDGVDPSTQKSYTDYLDITSWAQKYLVEEIVKNEGAGATSAWYYKPADSDGEKIFAGPVWDYDKSMGRDPKFKSSIGLTKLMGHTYSTDWYSELYKKPEFYQNVMNLYKEDFRPWITAHFNNEIDYYQEKLKDSVAMDEILWAKIYAEQERPCGTFAETGQMLKDWMNARIAFLDSVWIGGVSWHTVRFTYDNGTTDILLYAKDGETLNGEEIPNAVKDASTEFTDAKKQALEESGQGASWYDKETGQKIDEKSRITADMILVPKLN